MNAIDEGAATAAAEHAPGRTDSEHRTFTLPNWFGPWEVGLLALVVMVLAIASATSPFFATGQNFAITAAGAIGLALMVIPMTLLMISGEIDLSVASMFGLAGVVFGIAIESGVAWPLAMLVGLGVGALGGALNGVLTLVFSLPSLVVTIGTLALYRGLAYVLLESRAISALPPEFTSFAQTNVPGTFIPFTFLVFATLALVAAVLLHSGAVGREIYAVGSSAAVARFSGIGLRRLKLALFASSGAVAAFAGMVYAGYVSSARANNGTGLELTVIAIVLIGGVSMYGGRGSFAGVLLALALVTALGSWMNLGFVPSNVQNTVIGGLMIAAVVVPALAAKVRGHRLARR